MRKNPNDLQWAANFARLRAAAKLSRAQLGEPVGLSPKAIQAYELGYAKPRTCQLKPLADALGCTIAELLGEPRGDLTQQGEHGAHHSNGHSNGTRTRDRGARSSREPT